MEKTFPRFIIIDDDVTGNLINSLIIKNSLENVEVAAFDSAKSGLKHLRSEYPRVKNYGILFLDVDMPEMNGWQFLDEFKLLEKKIQDNIKIIMFSSSLDVRVKERALKNKNVSQFISKPLTSDYLKKMFS
jgi:two-component SAPR family response regulator